MKKGIAIALMLCFILGMYSVASAASVKLAIRGGRICLRTGAGTSHSVICHLKDGQKITVLSMGSIWSKVRTEAGKEGYIKSLYISGIGKNFADGTKYLAKTYKSYVKTNSGNASLRGGASSSTGVITKLANDTQVTVLGTNGSWSLVSTSGGTQGFVLNSSLSNTKSSGGSGGSSSSTGRTATVNASGLYMRSGPGMENEIITCLRRDTKVDVISGSGRGWWLVKYGSLTGYMWSGYLTSN